MKWTPTENWNRSKQKNVGTEYTISEFRKLKDLNNKTTLIVEPATSRTTLSDVLNRF